MKLLNDKKTQYFKKSLFDLRNKFLQVKEEIFDLIYPKICFSCRKPLDSKTSIYLCPACLKKISFHEPPFCNYCGCQVDSAEIEECPYCSSQGYNFTRGYSVFSYDTLGKECIHDLKYKSCTYLAGSLAQIMADFSRKYIKTNYIDLIVPIPLHWKKLRDRSFNQTELLANSLGKKLNIPVISVLKRIVHNPAQVDLPREKRLKNVKGIFACVRASNVLGKNVLLIDDVFTTGATLNECARVLKESGARDVWGFTPARG